MAGTRPSRAKPLARRRIALVLLALAGAPCAAVAAEPEGLAQSLGGSPGDPANGRAIVTNRQVGLCLLCHTGPFPEERFKGNLAPDLAGVGSRYSAAQLRLRLVDPARLNANSIMPSYFRTEGLTRVASVFAGKTILSGQQIEDVVAFLTTLRAETPR